MRIDRWLWWTRFYKTRGLASEAVKGGHIKLDGERCKAAKTVAIGDRLSITKGEDTWHVIVAALPSRRGPASEAQACFTETAESLERRLIALMLDGRAGLPLRCWLRDGEIVGQSRQTQRVEAFMLLEGLPDRALSRALGRRTVQRALAGVPAADDPSLATAFSIAARCRWLMR